MFFLYVSVIAFSNYKQQLIRKYILKKNLILHYVAINGSVASLQLDIKI